jgi:hypothetical protein
MQISAHRHSISTTSSWKFQNIIVYAFLVSAWYALFELYLRPWNWLSFGKFELYGLSTYHLFFMLPFYILISILPVWSGVFARKLSSSRRSKYALSAIGTFLLALLFEDALYFAFSFTPIRAGMWTTQWGYVSILGHYAIPDWYIVYGIVAFLAFSQAYSWTLGKFFHPAKPAFELEAQPKGLASNGHATKVASNS